MRHLWLAAVFSLMLTGGALATSSISCSDGTGNGVDISLGTVPGAAVIGARVFADGDEFSMFDEQLSVSQAFADGESLRIDFTDMNLEAVVARVRLFQADALEDFVMGGTLEVIGLGAYAITCEGP